MTMHERLQRAYKWFRSPRRFLKFLIAFIGASVTFHRVAGYDPDWGITNLSLSIEASVASAGIILVLEEIMDRLFVFLHEWRERQAREDQQQSEVLGAVLELAKAQRDAISEQADMLRGLARGYDRLLDIAGAHPSANAPDLDGAPAPTTWPALHPKEV